LKHWQTQYLQALQSKNMTRERKRED